MSNTVLLCTVGGSPQPVVTAIKETSPDFVCFFCTGNEGDSTGSMDQVKGEGLVVKASPKDPKPTLPSIPRQAGLGREQFEALEVPADDFDGGFLRMQEAINDLKRRDPAARLVADYTGGTKTMAVALFVAAMEAGEVELQLVTGARKDLKAVKDGTQGAIGASVGRLRTERAIKSHIAAWRRYGYQEAEEGLRTIRVVADSPDMTRYQLARSLSRAFALWDKFDHAGALASIENHGGPVSQAWPWMMPTIGLLAGDADKHKPEREPARLFDLWLNAERRAAQGRYDDAVARWYRLVEWTAQWQLKAELGIDTADFPEDKLPPGVDAKPDSDGKIKLALWQAWQAAEHLLPGRIPAFVAAAANELRHLLAVRNNSILAHGYRPVGEEDWGRVRDWTKMHFLPVLCELATEAGLRSPPLQLPDEPPDVVRIAP